MYRFAIMGCGRISKKHVDALKQLDDAHLVACCDTSFERAQQLSERTGCHPYSDYATMLDEICCDVVSICTPSGMHPEQVVMAAGAGCHVVSEKPLGLDLDAVDEAIRACDEAGRRLFVVQQLRLGRLVRLLRSAVDEGRFGRIHMILSNVLWTRPQEYYDLEGWRGTREFDGGCLANQASHFVDLVQWLGGPVEKVQAFKATQARHIEAEDSIVVNLKFAGGVLGSINVTTLAYPRNIEGSITVLGERGAVRIGGPSLDRIERWDFADDYPMDREVERNYVDSADMGSSGHLEYYRHVLEVLAGRNKPLVDGREGRKTVEIISAAHSAS